MSMNIPVIATDSDKFDFANGYIVVSEPNIPELKEKIFENLDREVNTRDYILTNWSEHTYADSLERGLNEIV